MASRIRDLRRKAGMTQEQLARKCSVSRSAVALWETEETKNLKPNHLFSAAKALGVDAQYLATGKPSVASSMSEFPVKVRAMMESYMQLPEHLQAQIGALVHSMAAESSAHDEEDAHARKRTDDTRQ